MIVCMPARLDAIDAAAVPVAAVPAWRALFEHAGLACGGTLLIHGAGGNVGAQAVQLARQGVGCDVDAGSVLRVGA